MSEATPETPPAAPAQGQQPPEQGAQSWDDLFKDESPADVRKALDESRKWESRAKSNSEAAKRVAEFEKERQAAMTDAERAVSEAEAKGRTAAATEFGKELAQTQFDALAGRRNPDFDTAKALKRLDLSSLLGEDGRPDMKEIQAAVDDLVPAPADGPPSFDGGPRTPAPAPQGMSQIIRKAAGRA